MTATRTKATPRAQRRTELLDQRRAERRRTSALDRAAEERRRQRIQAIVFGIVAVTVLGIGAYLAAGDLLGQRDTATTPGATVVRASMAGFTPNVITARAGETVTIDFWTTDAAPHLMNGVHTFISDELGVYEELPAAGPTGESRRTFTFRAPMVPGAYDVYCDTCCGGRNSPTMHGTIRVEEA